MAEIRSKKSTTVLLNHLEKYVYIQSYENSSSLVTWLITQVNIKCVHRYYIITWFQEVKIDVSGSRDNAWTILGSALLPSLNSSNVSLSSWFLSIWSNIFSTRFCGVFSSSVFDCWPCRELERCDQMQLHHRSRSKRSISKTYRLVNIFLLVPFFGSEIQSLSKILNCLVNILIPHVAKKKCCLHPSNSCLLAGKSYFLLFLGATADLKCLNNTSSSCHIKKQWWNIGKVLNPLISEQSESNCLVKFIG